MVSLYYVRKQGGVTVSAKPASFAVQLVKANYVIM